MIKDWIKNHLIPEKRDAGLWPGFADALQETYEDQIEPLLERLSARKSFFTMHPDDLDKRIKEYGQFFVIGQNGTASRPILLTQRLDEVHFKGTDQPIIATFWREFGNLPVTWEPLYAPVDQDLCPYGMFFTTAAGMEVAAASFGEFFLTSRGTISVDLNRLYEIYGFDEQDKLVKRLISDFDRIVAPLLPLETVFDGISLRLDFWLEEARDEIEILSITTGSKEPNFVFRPARELMQLTRTTIKHPTAAFAPDRRSLDTFMLTLDGMPSDAWRLDMPVIIPPLLPGGPENDPRLRSDNARLLLDTLGQWGCVMELTTGDVRRLAFPGWALAVVLPVAVSDRALIRKITWCSEHDSQQVMMSAQDNGQQMTVKGQNVTASATLQIPAPIMVLEGAVTHTQTIVSSLLADTESQHIAFDETPADAWPLDMQTIAAPILGSRPDPRLTSQGDTTLLDTLGMWGCVIELAGGEVRRYAFPGWADRVTLPMPLAVIVKITYSAEHEIVNASASVQDQEQGVSLKRKSVVTPQTVAQEEDAASLSKVSTATTPDVQGQTASTDSLPVAFDETPADAWRLDVQTIPAPVVPGSRPDTRLSSDGTKVTLETLGMWGCVIELTTGDVFRFAFPGWADRAILPFEIAQIRKITYSNEQDINSLSANVQEKSDQTSTATTRATLNQSVTETTTEMTGGQTTDQWSATAEVNKPNVQPDPATIDSMPLDAWPLDQEIPRE
ncbi:hypothetical protein K9O81_18635 [Leclercia adecarboxylata]|uniref:hypothetical protein n=1 Tax=Leclercia adecarboxylata TaxID=83655 RepID=UPI001CC0205D|nr:hypothetical protein [Leclercia adecarboxylata]MBZ3802389.1 hypothetical protein [Leclercia adecarboxylata]MBZ3807025.1 hypothetical protein [Leclercia adecarboxylata]